MEEKKQGSTQKECKISANNLKLLVTIWTLDAILYLFDGEQGRLLVLLQGAEKRLPFYPGMHELVRMMEVNVN